jgi:DNA replication and repair protein RecF
LVRHGSELRSMRSALVSQISPAAARAHQEISGLTEELEIRYAPGNEPDFAAHLLRSRPQEDRLRQTVVGPHRDDLHLAIDGMVAQTHSSEGQQRTLALALKLGQARIFSEEGPPPVLLIDDIFGELDARRRHALFGALDPGTQKLVTATAPQWPKEIGADATWHLENHQLRRVE